MGSELRCLRAAPCFVCSCVRHQGAGDAYVAGIIYGLAHALEVEAAMQLASYIAARSCLHVGARDGLPTRAEAFAR